MSTSHSKPRKIVRRFKIDDWHDLIETARQRIDKGANPEAAQADAIAWASWAAGQSDAHKEVSFEISPGMMDDDIEFEATPLSWAIIHGLPSTCQALLEAGWDADWTFPINDRISLSLDHLTLGWASHIARDHELCQPILDAWRERAAIEQATPKPKKSKTISTRRI
jgi:hypothetical protein